MKHFFRSIFGRKNAPSAADPAPAAASEPAVTKPAEGCKVLGTKERPVKKVLAVTQLEVKAEGGKVVLKGYANTKGQADRYGDVPTVFAPLRSYVYELADFRKNPVMLIDHMNSVGHIAGSYKVLREDENGLYFEAEFSESDYPMVRHARTVYAEGHGKALSIAGRWYFENKDKPEQLTYAEIFEISLVGVGADPNALAAVEQPKAVPVAPPAPCCYRHAGNVEKDLPCASLEEVTAELEAVETLKTVVNDLEDSAHAAEIKRFLQTQGA